MKKHLSLLLLLAAAATVVRAGLTKDIEYANVDGVSLRLDAYVPDGPGPFPAVIMVHGGGWNSGDKESKGLMGPMNEPLSRAGFAWFQINYRLAPKYRYPACFDDVQAAIRWIKAHTAEYHVDPDRLALAGESAGGHLVDLAAARADKATHVNAVVSFYGVYDLVAQAKAKGAGGNLGMLFGISELNDRTEPILRAASAATYLKPGLPPFLLVHGDVDPKVPHELDVDFQAKLRALGGSADLITIKGGGHGMLGWAKVAPGYQDQVVAWLKKTLGPPSVYATYPGTEGKPINLWPEGIPGYRQDGPAESVVDGRVYHVRHPTLIAYLPPPGTACGTAIIDAPGGGYVRLPAEKGEGAEPRWLNHLGITVFVLTYRFGDDAPSAPLQDVLRAIRLVRSHAAEYGIRPDRIGIIGDSAGGHVATAASTLYDDPAGRTGSPLDQVSGRPDFAILLYPVVTMEDPYVHKGSRGGLLGPNPTPAAEQHYSTELHVTKDTPPAFIVSTQEDHSVPLENAVAYFMALRRAGVRAELHLYEKGPHGFGFTAGLGPTSDWPARCVDWLRFHDLIPAAPGS